MPRWLSLLIVISAMALVAACGGSPSSQPAGSIKVTLTEMKFTPKSIAAKAGEVDLYLVNAGSTTHDMVVVDSTGKQIGKSDLIAPGDSTLFKLANLAAGTYTVYCDLPGHRDSGMEGTLAVT